MSLGIVMVARRGWQEDTRIRGTNIRLGRMLYYLIMQRSGSTFELANSTSRFRQHMQAVKESLGPQDFAWYPYDSFGYFSYLDLLLRGDLNALMAMIGKDPVLDVGCGDGALSFYLESLGCEVDSIDNPPTNHNGMRGVVSMKEKLRSEINIYEMDIDGHFQPPQDRYGLTLFLGILYHLKNPFHVLETLAARTRFCLLGTRVARYSPRGVALRSEPLAYLVDQDETNNDATNFWIFSEEGLRRIVLRAGWRIRGMMTDGDTRLSNPVDAEHDERAFCLLESSILPPEYAPALLNGWHELTENWRWTAKNFSVTLGRDPVVQPDKLELWFHLMPGVLSVTGPVAVRAIVNGRRLEPETFHKAGPHVYRAILPPGAEGNGNSLVEFELDKALAPCGNDLRELGLLVSFDAHALVANGTNVPIRFV